MFCHSTPDLQLKTPQNEEEEEPYLSTIVYACLLIFTLCTLPAAPVSKSFGLCSSFESVLLTPTKVPGTNFFDC